MLNGDSAKIRFHVEMSDILFKDQLPSDVVDEARYSIARTWLHCKRWPPNGTRALAFGFGSPVVRTLQIGVPIPIVQTPQGERNDGASGQRECALCGLTGEHIQAGGLQWMCACATFKSGIATLDSRLRMLGQDVVPPDSFPMPPRHTRSSSRKAASASHICV